MTRARRAKLIVDNMPLVAKIARQVARNFAPHIPIEDFVQSGMVGLCQAAKRCSRVSKFEAFSYFRIRGAMIDAHNRRAYREELNSSLEWIQDGQDDRAEGLSRWFATARLATDGAPLPDEVVARKQQAAIAYRAIADLPADERYVLEQALDGVRLRAIAESCEHSPTWTREKLAAAREKVAAAVAQRAKSAAA